jgi:hypothetical protein
LGVAKIVFGKESVDEFRALLGRYVSMFPQKVTNAGQSPLQELETVPFHNIKPGIFDMALIDGMKPMVNLTEIVDSWDFWQ